MYVPRQPRGKEPDTLEMEGLLPGVEEVIFNPHFAAAVPWIQSVCSIAPFQVFQGKAMECNIFLLGRFCF